MVIRLIEVIIPEGRRHRIPEIVEGLEYLDMWEHEISDGMAHFHILTQGEKTQSILDELEDKLGWVEGFRVFIIPVEAILPRPVEPEKEEKEEKEETAEEKKAKVGKRAEWRLTISREELYQDVNAMCSSSRTYFLLMVLSTIVAAMGLYANNAAVIIGAMMIAPLLGPNVALSFSTLLADFDLAGRAGKAILIGVGATFLFAIPMGFLLGVDPTVHEVSLRTQVGLTDVILALASGSAAAISITLGVASALVGVMVAVALLPPLVNFGLLLGAGYLDPAGGAFLLFLVNLICINLAGVVTFLLQGIRPRSWWEADRAKKATRLAILIWSLILLLLVMVIMLSERVL